MIKIGMLFFLFAAGLEVNLAQLQRRGWSVALTSTLGILVPFGLGHGSVLFLPGLWMLKMREETSGFIGVITVLILAAAALVEYVGIHAIFGAFLVGVALGQGLDRGEENHAHEIIYQFAVSFFAPLYFVSVALKVDSAANFDLLLVFFVILIASTGKVFGASLGAWLSGMTHREALAIGFGMNARGAMEMILASVALECKVIDQRIFVALVVMTLVTSILTGPVLQRLMNKTG